MKDIITAIGPGKKLIMRKRKSPGLPLPYRKNQITFKMNIHMQMT